MKLKSYEELIAWQLAMQLARDTYRATGGFPKAETYGLAAQLRRAVVSVPSNIAEGQGRLTRGEFRQFLGNARGSLFEVQTQIRLAKEFGFIEEATAKLLLAQASRLARVLNGLLAALPPGQQHGGQ